MTAHSPPPLLSDDQKQQFCSLLMVGCDRETASKYLGFTPAQVQSELKRDAKFVRQALHAEGSAELRQMQILHEATKDAKHWRASAWWLERRAPERFARRVAGAITASEWRQFLEALAEMMVSEITHEPDRRRLLTRLSQLAESISTELPMSLAESASGNLIEENQEDLSDSDAIGDR